MNFFILNTLRQRQSGLHFLDDIFKGIFLNENVWISIKILLNFVPKGPINNSIIGSHIALAPARWQAIVWTNDGKFTDAYMYMSYSASTN